MPSNLYITIDTEPDCDTKWNRIRPLTFSSVLDGIPLILRPLWNKLGVNPIYFVCPEVLMNDDCCKVLIKEIEYGAIIGTHLHSEYIEPNIGEAAHLSIPSIEFPCFAHSDEIEFEKIKNLTLLIEKKLGIRPVWYRAARYGADLATIQSLRRLGYLYDSSFTPQINWSKSAGPDHTLCPEQPYFISDLDVYDQNQIETGIQEIPLSIHAKRFGFLGAFTPNIWLFYNWLRPTHMSVWEQKKMIRYFFKKYTTPTLVMMFHSQEIMVNKSPFVRNRWMQKTFLSRLERTITYYQKIKKGYEF